MVDVMVFNATFNNISVSRQFYWWKKPGYPEKNPPKNFIILHKVLSNTPRHERDPNSQR